MKKEFVKVCKNLLNFLLFFAVLNKNSSLEVSNFDYIITN